MTQLPPFPEELETVNIHSTLLIGSSRLLTLSQMSSESCSKILWPQELLLDGSWRHQNWQPPANSALFGELCRFATISLFLSGYAIALCQIVSHQPSFCSALWHFIDLSLLQTNYSLHHIQLCDWIDSLLYDIPNKEWIYKRQFHPWQHLQISTLPNDIAAMKMTVYRIDLYGICILCLGSMNIVQCMGKRNYAFWWYAPALSCAQRNAVFFHPQELGRGPKNGNKSSEFCRSKRIGYRSRRLNIITSLFFKSEADFWRELKLWPREFHRIQKATLPGILFDVKK